MNKRIDDFLNQKVIAVVGASNDRSKFGNKVLLKLKRKGYEAIPVNPKVAFVEGETCYASLGSLPKKADGVVCIVPPGVTEEVVKEASLLGIERVWMQPGAQSAQAVAHCDQNGIACISQRCILVETE